MSSLDSRREPLLGSGGLSRNAPSRWSGVAKLCVLPSFVLAYVMASTIERVVFARMAASMHGQVLLMHTALAAFNTLLFMVLRLARSQSSRSVVSAKLQALRPMELLLMAVLDAMHSLLALDGATRIMGTMQVMLVQGIVPFSMLVAPCLPADPLQLMPAYNKPQLAAAAGIAAAVCLLLLPLQSALVNVHERNGTRPGVDGQQGQAADVDLAGPWSERLTFAASAAFAALSSVYKRQRLTRAPLDPLLLNSWLGGTQLIAGLALGPPLLLVLHHTPVPVSLRELLHGMQYLFARSHSQQSAPLLLCFFTASTIASIAALLCLRKAGDAALGLASALVLPAALLAFLRPVPLPFSWAAPPEQLTSFHACVALGMSLALFAYHLGGMAWCMAWCAPPRDVATAGRAAGGSGAALPATIRRANPPDVQTQQGSARTVRTFVLPSLAGTARGRSGDVI